ncbi:hypothetical protein NQ315_005698 [Exocentrus adspersus]|uniref:Uncharacterized protein n=1 Tax=Exocentrus adspersus TaxID=1586481 RepID=A0AAV8VJD2_9CUCU|nr:hypothetical protein NQ315_005698 [Exocentrus adspersus]
MISLSQTPIVGVSLDVPSVLNIWVEMADVDSLIVASAAFVVIAGLLKRKRKKKRWWTTALYRNRLTTRGPSFLSSMVEEENGHFKNFTRMSSADFIFLLEAIPDDISRNDTKFRKAVTAEETLAITLRYLATGDSYTSLQYLFNVSKQLMFDIYGIYLICSHFLWLLA